MLDLFSFSGFDCYCIIESRRECHLVSLSEFYDFYRNIYLRDSLTLTIEIFGDCICIYNKGRFIAIAYKLPIPRSIS